MKYYKVTTEIEGMRVIHPEVGHTNYKNIGYNLDLTECIWMAEDDVIMPIGTNCVEITEEDSLSYLESWKPDIEEVEEEGE